MAETGSTNDDLIDAATAGAPDRSVLVADHQTAGRGRLGRRWEAPAGVNLLVSVLFLSPPDPVVSVSRRIGLATIDACRAAAAVEASLKWPNDVLVGERKLAGILAQRTRDGGVVVGLGLNVGWAPDGATSLRAEVRSGDPPPPLDVLAALLVAFDALPTDVTARYREALSTLGRRVEVELPDGRIDGTASDVDADGRLVVVDRGGTTHRLDVGDVVHVAAPAPPA